MTAAALMLLVSAATVPVRADATQQATLSDNAKSDTASRDIAKSDGGESGQAEVAEDRENGLNYGRMGERCGCEAAEGLWMALIYYSVEKSPGKSHQEVDRDRHADGFAGDLFLLQHAAEVHG